VSPFAITSLVLGCGFGAALVGMVLRANDLVSTGGADATSDGRLSLFDVVLARFG